MQEFVEYLRAVEFSLRENPSWRAGQAYFNVLWERREDIAREIRSGNVDPFYNNDLIPVFLHHVANLWEA